MRYTPGSIESEGHVVITGPIKGSVTLSDGTVLDVSDPVVEVPADKADEVADLIGKRYAAEGHPDVDGDFTYDPPKRATKKKG